ncbi:MAG: OsmC family protein [Bacteroidetes bacterium]|nr:OsmC family protein [Bacteroidota bacterium]
MSKKHHYQLNIAWTGNNGTGTSNYAAYSRNFNLNAANKETLALSSDTAFRGDETKHNPETMLVASISSCHMLWYLHLCADAGIIVTAYEDNATGTMEQDDTGAGKFTEVTLYPKVTITDSSKKELAIDLHHKANHFCFIAQSCNFQVQHRPEIIVSV